MEVSHSVSLCQCTIYTYCIVISNIVYDLEFRLWGSVRRKQRRNEEGRYLNLTDIPNIY